MARITVEDCASKVSNRFDLVIESVERVRQILLGAPLTVEKRRDKNAVVALREIAAGTISVEELRASIVKNLRRHVQIDPEEQDVLDALEEETAWLNTLESSVDANAEEEVIEDGLVIHDDTEEV